MNDRLLGKENLVETKRKRENITSHKVGIKPPSMYNVIMLNDDFTPMDFVVWALMTYFDKSADEANRLMLTVHNGKRAVVGKYPYDVAVTKCSKVIDEARKKGYPFKVIVDKAD